MAVRFRRAVRLALLLAAGLLFIALAPGARRRLNAAVESLWLEAPELHADLLEGMQACPAPQAGERLP
jgi:hypothetical protein